MNPAPLQPPPGFSPPAPWHELRRFTTARIALGRAGGSLPTREVLAFGGDHALARDAVHSPFDAGSLADELGRLAPNPLRLATAATDRATFLRRPDLGRKLPDDARTRLAALASAGCDLSVMVSDGLSAQATRHAAPLLQALLPRLLAAGWQLAPLCVVRHARVAVMSEIGAALRASLALILLGERPGLGTPDSLGAYFEFAPGPGRTNADRNCVSNIRPGGLPPADAAALLFDLLTAARQTRTSGIALQADRTDAPAAAGFVAEP